jgi:hypothetical protein
VIKRRLNPMLRYSQSALILVIAVLCVVLFILIQPADEDVLWLVLDPHAEEGTDSISSQGHLTETNDSVATLRRQAVPSGRQGVVMVDAITGESIVTGRPGVMCLGHCRIVDGDNGSYELELCGQACSATVIGAAPGYASATAEVVDEASCITLYLFPVCELQVRVADERGAPIDGVEVLLRQPERGVNVQSSFRITSNGQGVCDFANIQTGVQTDVCVRYGSVRREVHLTLTQRRSVLEIVCGRGRTLTGIVEDEEATPIVGALVSIREIAIPGTQVSGVASCITNSGGGFRVSGLLACSYELTVRDEKGNSQHSESVYAASQGIEFADHVRIQLVRSKEARGRLFESGSRAAICNARAVVIGSKGVYSEAETDYSGAFELAAPGAEPYSVMVGGDIDDGYETTSMTISDRRGGVLDIEVNRKQIVTLSLIRESGVSSGSDVHIKAVDPTFAGIAHHSDVAFVWADLSMMRELRIEPGEYLFESACAECGYKEHSKLMVSGSSTNEHRMSKCNCAADNEKYNLEIVGVEPNACVRVLPIAGRGGVSVEPLRFHGDTFYFDGLTQGVYHVFAGNEFQELLLDRDTTIKCKSNDNYVDVVLAADPESPIEPNQRGLLILNGCFKSRMDCAVVSGRIRVPKAILSSAWLVCKTRGGGGVQIFELAQSYASINGESGAVDAGDAQIEVVNGSSESAMVQVFLVSLDGCVDGMNTEGGLPVACAWIAGHETRTFSGLCRGMYSMLSFESSRGTRELMVRIEGGKALVHL